MDRQQNSGFVLISLLLAIVIIVLLYLYFHKSSGTDQSIQQTGQKAEQQVKANNAQMLQENIDTQNTLNSINQ